MLGAFQLLELPTLLLAAVAALGLFLAYRAHSNAQRLSSFERVAEAAGRASQRAPRQPDLAYAAKGFVGVALMRKNGINIDLHAVELGNAKHLLENGCSVDQALSARWGGVTAMEADLGHFQVGIDAYEETKAELGGAPQGDNPEAKFHVSARLYLAALLKEQPYEFERFLRYINA